MKREKRKNPRYPCQVPVLCKKGTLFDCSQTMDVSSGGVGFICEHSVPVNTKMAVEIIFSPNVEPELAFAQVRWVKALPNSEGYHLGSKFINVTSKVKTRLKEIFC